MNHSRLPRPNGGCNAFFNSIMRFPNAICMFHALVLEMLAIKQVWTEVTFGDAPLAR